MIRSTAPSAKVENVFFNNYPILSGPLNCGQLQDSPHNSSDSSPEDDLDSITPVRINVRFDFLRTQVLNRVKVGRIPLLSLL